MNRWTRMALVASALFVISAPILAQTPAVGTTPAAPRVKGAGRAGQGRRAGMATLPISAIDALVTLTADQKARITAIQTKLKTDTAAAAADKVQTRQLSTVATADIKAVLTPAQEKTLTEKLPVVMLLNQSKAIPAAAFGSVNLTSEQMDKIKTAATATQDKMKAVAKEDRKTKNPEILAEFKTQVESILTADQKLAISKVPARKAGKKKIAA
jgi:Spy/CpxP family protein refolding chaperone